MIELNKGRVYKSSGNGLVEYVGIDRFCGEETFKFKRIEIGGMDYILPSEIDEFLCIDAKEKTYDELVAMNKELLAALEGLLSDMRLRAKLDGDVDSDGCVVLNCGSGVLYAANNAIAKAKAAA